MDEFTSIGGGVRRDDPDTSRAAAESIHVTQLEDVVLGALFAAGSHGLTTFELADVTKLSLVTVSPRLRPLARKGRVYDTGLRRENPASGRNAIVWCALASKDARTQDQGAMPQVANA